jgi:hypothetical protein
VLSGPDRATYAYLAWITNLRVCLCMVVVLAQAAKDSFESKLTEQMLRRRHNEVRAPPTTGTACCSMPAQVVC